MLVPKQNFIACCMGKAPLLPLLFQPLLPLKHFSVRCLRNTSKQWGISLFRPRTQLATTYGNPRAETIQAAK